MASKIKKNAWTGQSASCGDGSSHLSEMVSYDWRNKHPLSQWEFQEVLYHIRPYFVGIFPYIGLI